MLFETSSNCPAFTPDGETINVIEHDGTLIISNATANRQIRLTTKEARAVFLAIEQESKKETLRTYLEGMQNADGSYWIGSIANVRLCKEDLEILVNKATPTFISNCDDNNDWSMYADNALEAALTIMEGRKSA